MTYEDARLYKLRLAEDLRALKADDRFSRVIMAAYVSDGIMTTGKSFDDTPDQRDYLKAVTHLLRWMETIENEAEILKKETS